MGSLFSRANFQSSRSTKVPNLVPRGGYIWRMHSESQRCICFVCGVVLPLVCIWHTENGLGQQTLIGVYRFVRRSHYTARLHKTRRQTNQLITGGSGVVKEKLTELFSGGCCDKYCLWKNPIIESVSLDFRFRLYHDWNVGIYYPKPQPIGIALTG